MAVYDPTLQRQRLARAATIGESLARGIQAWASEHPLAAVPHIADNRLSFTVALNVLKEPPCNDWSLIFGEAVHQLRAALDNLLVGLARHSGVHPKLLKRIQFPISETSNGWKSDRAHIRYLPDRIQDAVTRIQPFQRGAEVASDLLLILRNVSNQDKHNINVTASIQMNEISHQGIVEFETEAGAADSVPPDITLYEVLLKSGEVLLEHRAKGRIAAVRGSYAIRSQVRLQLPDGRSEGVTVLLASLCTYTETVFRYVLEAY